MSSVVAGIQHRLFKRRMGLQSRPVKLQGQDGTGVSSYVCATYFLSVTSSVRGFSVSHRRFIKVGHWLFKVQFFDPRISIPNIMAFALQFQSTGSIRDSFAAIIATIDT